MLGRQDALTNKPLHDCIADLQFSRGFLLSNPFLLMIKDGDVMISTHPRNARCVPGLALTRLITQSIQDGCNGLVWAQLCQLCDEFNDVAICTAPVGAGSSVYANPGSVPREGRQ